MLLFKIALILAIIRVIIMGYEFLFVTTDNLGHLIAESVILAGLFQAKKHIKNGFIWKKHLES